MHCVHNVHDHSLMKNAKSTTQDWQLDQRTHQHEPGKQIFRVLSWCSCDINLNIIVCFLYLLPSLKDAISV